MITNTILPSFYIVELEGEAANLEFLLGKNFGIETITIASDDFYSDINAIAAAQECVEFFLDNPMIDAEGATQDFDLNPEFFPTQQPIKLSAAEQEQEDELMSKAAEMSSENKIAFALTRRFDKMGDHVIARLKVDSSNFNALARIVCSEKHYIQEKGKEYEERATNILGPHRENESRTIIH